VTALHQTGDQRHLPERALHEVRLGEPGVEIVAQHVLGEELGEIEALFRDHLRQVAQPPQSHAVVVGDEAQGLRARAVETPREQHAERLVREAPLEGITDEVLLRATRKGLDKQLAGLGYHRARFLHAQPFVHRIGQVLPPLRTRHHLAHAVGEEGRKRELAAVVGRNLRLGLMGSGHVGAILAHAFEAQHIA